MNNLPVVPENTYTVPAPPNNIPTLVLIRQSKGLTLEEIANNTKISMRYLRAIEAGRLGILPGGVYTVNYLRQYAEAIDCERPAMSTSS